MKTSLRVLFKTLGPVLDVTVHRNLRLRGQAFVAFDKTETAERAVKEVNKFPLYGKPMVSFLFPLSSCPPLSFFGQSRAGEKRRERFTQLLDGTANYICQDAVRGCRQAP
jgi:RNA recognition motif-containing protein